MLRCTCENPTYQTSTNTAAVLVCQASHLCVSVYVKIQHASTSTIHSTNTVVVLSSHLCGSVPTLFPGKAMRAARL